MYLSTVRKYLSSSHLLGEDVLVVLDAFVPHRLQDGGERSHSDARSHQHHHLVPKHVLAGRAERPVYRQPGKHRNISIFRILRVYELSIITVTRDPFR